MAAVHDTVDTISKIVDGMMTRHYLCSTFPAFPAGSLGYACRKPSPAQSAWRGVVVVRSGHSSLIVKVDVGTRGGGHYSAHSMTYGDRHFSAIPYTQCPVTWFEQCVAGNTD
jgi:hypothetical protein